MVLKSLFNPLNVREIAKKNMHDIFRCYLTKEMVLYDIGCGKKPHLSFVEPRVKKYIGVDIEDGFYETQKVDIIGTAYDVPIDAEQADAVLSTQVFEHLERPLDGIKETHRILKRGGLFILGVPFLYPIHAQPRDFYRYTKYGVDYLLSDNGFEVIEKKELSGFWMYISYMINIYFSSLNRGMVQKLKIMSVFLWLQRLLFQTFHSLEGFLFKVFKKDIDSFRMKWAISYVYVARKIG